MIRVRVWGLALLCVLVGIVGYFSLEAMIMLGWTPWSMHPVSASVLLLGAALLLWSGNGVRRLVKGEPTTVTPLQAVQILLIAQSSAILSAVISGLMVANITSYVQRLESDFMQMQLWGAVAFLVGAILLGAAGLIVQHWCTVDSSDEDPTESNGSNATLLHRRKTQPGTA